MGLLRRCLTKLVPVIVLGALVASGCSSGTQADNTPEADAYEAMLRWILLHTEDSVASSGSKPRPVFVDNLGPEEIALDVQVELVVRLAGDAELRFVDSRKEAIDVDSEDRPVRDGGVLVGLGVVPDEPPAAVRGEVYLGLNDVLGWRFPLKKTADRWELDNDPEVVDPEGLVETP
ncbi:MAG: hypothetical protein GY745_00480 [Actinomycetia bacterium]|nr:hypothetical protein [Actinomycetes bacterium]MCP4083523.1 hypothetical protein [Actinomycetes bacterium]